MIHVSDPTSVPVTEVEGLVIEVINSLASRCVLLWDVGAQNPSKAHLSLALVAPSLH